jgi:hypothetical protein
MGDQGDHFRRRAQECRKVAAQADSSWAKMLLELADELDEEAERSDQGEAAGQSEAPIRPTPIQES